MAWTITATYDGSEDWNNSQSLHRFKLACTSDASASGDQTLSTLIEAAYPAQKAGAIMAMAVRGSLAYAVKYEPDGTDTPTSNPDVTLDDETGGVIFDKTFTAATALIDPVSNTVGVSPPVDDIVFASSTLADTKVANFYIYLIK